jgi:hypothetical protein
MPEMSPARAGNGSRGGVRGCRFARPMKLKRLVMLCPRVADAAAYVSCGSRLVVSSPLRRLRRMYEVDDRDRVVELDDVPQSSVGAPLPVVVANEYTVQLAYHLSVPDPDWDGSYVRVVDAATGNPVVLVRFEDAAAWFHGPPNDEAFEGHPLASRGLRPYAAFRIEESSWIRRLELLNSVHPQHAPETFWRLCHFVFAFHDSTFECVARSFTAVEVEGPLTRVAQQMASALGPR